MPPVKKKSTRRQPAAPRRRRAPQRTQQRRADAMFRTPQQRQRTFGRRGEMPSGARAWLLALLPGQSLYTRIFGGAVLVLFLGALGYGLVMGGHIAALGAGIVHQSKALVAATGLRVNDVTVSGRERTPPEEILGALGIARGDYIFDLDLEAARQKLEHLEWVEQATVSRRLPDVIHVELVERRPFAVWQRGGRLSLVDERGTPITDRGLSNFVQLPLVVGHGAHRAAKALMEKLEKQPTIAARVQAAVRVADRRWNLKLHNGVEVRLPAVDVAGALGRLARLDEKNGLLSRKIEAVDLRVPGRISILIDSEAAARRRAVYRAESGKGGRDA